MIKSRGIHIHNTMDIPSNCKDIYILVNQLGDMEGQRE